MKNDLINQIEVKDVSDALDILKAAGTEDLFEKGKWKVGDEKVYQGVTYYVSDFNDKGTPKWRKKKGEGKPSGPSPSGNKGSKKRIQIKDYFDEIKLAERIKSEIIELSKNEKDNYFNFKSVTSNKFVTNKKEFRNLFKATEKMGVGYKVLDRIMELEPSIKTLDSNIRESLVNIINENWTTKSPEEIAKLIQEKLEGFKEGLKVRISDITAAFDGLII